MTNGLRKNIMETIPFKISSNNIKHLGVSLTKRMKDYDENFKKKVEEGIRITKDILYSWIRRINIVKMVILLKVIYIYIFNIITIKIAKHLLQIQTFIYLFIFKLPIFLIN